MPFTQKICAAILLTGLLSACATTSAPNATVAETAAVQTAAEKAPVQPVQAATVAQAASAEQTYDTTMVCKRTKVVGSNFKKKMCMTTAEWNAMSDAARRETSTLQKNGSFGLPSGN